MKKLKLFLLSAVVFYTLTACEKSTSETDRTFFYIQGEKGFTGKLSGTNAYIGLLIADEEALIYLCNGEEEISEWFRGSIDNPTSFELRNQSGTNVIVDFIDNALVGNVTFSNAETFSFSASPLSLEGAGVYQVIGEEATKDQVSGGWILNSASDQRGAFNIGSKFLDTPNLNPTDSFKTVQLGEKSYPLVLYIIGGATLPTKKLQKTFIETVKDD